MRSLLKYTNLIAEMILITKITKIIFEEINDYETYQEMN